MNCRCCFYKDKIKYLLKCEYCKKNQIKQYKWYEWHIISIRDNPSIRLLNEIFITFGSLICFIIAYNKYYQLIDLNYYDKNNDIVNTFLIIYICILSVSLDSLIKLNNNIYYQLN